MGRDTDYRRALKRLRKVDSAEVLNWAQTTTWALQSSLDGYQATRDEAALDEALTGAVSLLAAVEVLLDREQSGKGH